MKIKSLISLIICTVVSLISFALINHNANYFNLNILGNISSKDPLEGVVLIKKNETKEVIALKAKEELTLSGIKYEVTGVTDDYFDIKNKSTNEITRVTRPGFRKKYIEKKRAPKPTRVSYRGGYNEDGFSRNDSNISMTKAFRDEIVEQKSKIIMEAGAEPYQDKYGNILGFQLFGIEKDSIYEKAGLLDNDIIKQINGTPLTGAIQAINILKSLEKTDEISSISFVVLRGGQEFPVSVDIK